MLAVRVRSPAPAFIDTGFAEVTPARLSLMSSSWLEPVIVIVCPFNLPVTAMRLPVVVEAHQVDFHRSGRGRQIAGDDDRVASGETDVRRLYTDAGCNGDVVCRRHSGFGSSEVYVSRCCDVARNRDFTVVGRYRQIL